MPTLLPDLPQVEAAIIAGTNTVRSQAKLAPVVVSPQLTAAARAYAALLATTNRFSHYADGSPSQRAVRAGYQACGIAENIAMRRDSGGFETGVLAASVVDGWLQSPAHARNLRAHDMTEAGVGLAKSPVREGEYIAVQLFGRPQSSGIAFDVKNSLADSVIFTFEGKPRELAPNKVYTLRACSSSPLTFATKTAPITRLQAANGKTYTVSGNPLRVDITARAPGT